MLCTKAAGRKLSGGLYLQAPSGRDTTPAPAALVTPVGTPKSARIVAEGECVSAPQDGPLGPAAVSVAKALLPQLKQLESTFAARKATVPMKQELAEAIATASKLEFALSLVEGVITRKTLERTLKAELDATASRIIDSVLLEIPRGHLLVSGTNACNCAHNGDTGRWRDSNSPAAVATSLVNRGGGCYDATVQGHMCLSTEAANQQSYHNDWFLWTAITCYDGAARAQLTIS